MNDDEVAALRLACVRVEPYRLARLADVAGAGGSLPDAVDAVRTSTVFGESTAACTLWASPAGMRITVGGDHTARPQWVTWAAIAAVLLPVLRGDLGHDVVAAFDARDRRRWAEVLEQVSAAAFSAVPVQASLFEPAPTSRHSGARAGRRGP